MTRFRWVLLAAGLCAGLLISGRIVLVAQDREDPAQHDPGAVRRPGAAEVTRVVPDTKSGATREPAGAVAHQSAGAASIQDALLRPYRFPFSRPTSLEQVCAHLQQTLSAPVVLDRAALNRQHVDPQDAVQLDLDGVRLKTGLKLLLDQSGLTYRLVAEDNLLIITDSAGAEDPNDRILSELRLALHRDLHDVQDAVDELRDYLGDDGEKGARVQKPTIIEEMPDAGGAKPGNIPDKPGNVRPKPEGPGAPATGGRPVPSRVPLSGRRRAR